MGESCSVCGSDLVWDDDGNAYELEGDQPLHTSERCNEVVANTQPEGMWRVRAVQEREKEP